MIYMYFITCSHSHCLQLALVTLQAFRESEKKDGLAQEVENLKKDLEMERQRHSKTKNAAEEQKSKMDAEVETLKNTISQSALEKRALQHQFEEAMQRIQRSEAEVKQLKNRQE